MSKHELTRRAFIGGSLGLCVTWPAVCKGLAQEGAGRKALLPARKRVPNPFVENGKPIVVIVKGTGFAAMLAAGMKILGGFARFGTGRPTIVKPNFVFDKKSEYPTTTDEKSVLTTVDFLQKEGFNDITVADRRGKRVNGRAGGKFEWSGLNDKAEAGGFKTDSLMDNDVAEAVEVRDARWTEMASIGVIKKIYEAGLIINMPTLKRHSQTHLTCSLKNMMGVLDVPTTEKMHLWGKEDKAVHDSMSADAVTRRLCLAIAEAAMAVTPEITIIDARTVLCRHHVSTADGDPREANRVIISGDPLAADVAATRILKEVYETYELGFTKDTFQRAADLGIGVADPSGAVVKEIAA